MGSEIFAVALAAGGLLLLLGRLWPRPGWVPPSPGTPQAGPRWQRLSIIVPARNEAANLPRLLPSLAQLSAPQLAGKSLAVEVIIVDDHSTDDTAAVATAFCTSSPERFRLVHAGARPPGWGGKQWACQVGADAATGELLLFTDADTVHEPDSLLAAVGAMDRHRLDLLSACPFHDGDQLWERLLGPFQLLLLALTGPYRKPRPRRLFVIGQYMLWTRAAYQAFGGHAAVADALVEDVPMANRLVARGGRYLLWTESRLFRVRMYATLGEFVAGWRRNVRAGFLYGSPWAGLDATLIIASLIMGGQPTAVTMAIAALAWSFAAWRQGAYGRFPPWTILGLPFALSLFTWVSALALVDRLSGRPVRWKGRAYPSPVVSSG